LIYNHAAIHLFSSSVCSQADSDLLPPSSKSLAPQQHQQHQHHLPGQQQQQHHQQQQQQGTYSLFSGSPWLSSGDNKSELTVETPHSPTIPSN